MASSQRSNLTHGFLKRLTHNLKIILWFIYWLIVNSSNTQSRNAKLYTAFMHESTKNIDIKKICPGKLFLTDC